jgi:hypothetical protein
MNGRIDAGPGNSLPWDTTARFSPSGSIIFKWIEDGTYTSPRIRIYAHGQWGNLSIGHTAVAIALTALPGSTTHTVANRVALYALTPTTGQTALVTSDTSYWEAIGGYWVRTVVEVNAGTVSAYGEPAAAIKTITVPVADIPQISGIAIVAGKYYDLCFEENGLHAPQYDATFALEPIEIRQGLPVTHCELCGIRLKKPRPQKYWRNGKPKCAMQ